MSAGKRCQSCKRLALSGERFCGRHRRQMREQMRDWLEPRQTPHGCDDKGNQRCAEAKERIEDTKFGVDGWIGE
jgi:hypothetical protein